MAENGYSAKVALTLIVGGEKLSLSHIGPSGLVVRDDCEAIGPCDATLVIQVDDSTQQSRIFLHDGIPGPGQLLKFI
ncbi:MAG: hypothetical protein JNG90_09965 [Planctomycetaceae bacterium]|nr:hypothetical protein [Planctomycetaceae bacterium]